MRALRRVLAVGAISSTVAVSTALVAPHLPTPPAGATTGYAITGATTVRAHTMPELGSPTVRFLAGGTPIDIVCQERTASVFGGTGIWDRLADGSWVTDFYTTTPAYNAFSPGLAQCGGAPVPARAADPTPAPATAPAPGRAVGRTVGRNLGYAGQCTWGALAQWFAVEHSYPAVSGNAAGWAISARRTGWTVVADAQPRSIVVFQPGVQGADRTYGHVAWVDSVEQRGSARYVHVTEMNGTAGPARWDHRVVRDVDGMSYILAP